MGCEACEALLCPFGRISDTHEFDTVVANECHVSYDTKKVQHGGGKIVAF